MAGRRDLGPRRARAWPATLTVAALCLPGLGVAPPAAAATPGVSMTMTRTTALVEPGNAATQATIGEVVSYTLETRQDPDTTIVDYVLSDDLADTGLELLPATVEAQTALVGVGEPCAYAGPVTTPSAGGPLTVTGQAIGFTVPDTTLGPQVGCAVVRFDARVRDVPAGAEPLNRRPDSVNNTATLVYGFDDGTTTEPVTETASASTQIVEPNLLVQKRSNAVGRLSPGQPLTYQLVVTNQNAAQVSTAHDVVVSDTLPAAVAAVVDPGGATVSDGVLTWDLASLAPGASTTLTYVVQLGSPLVAGSVVTNAASATASSLDGAATGERSAQSACSGAGTCPGYRATASLDLLVAVPVVAKDASPAIQTIGGVSTYQLRVTLPANLDYGASPLILGDDLAAAATTYVRTVGISCLLCSPAERDALTTPEQNGTAASGAPAWGLGVLGPSAFTRSIVIQYDARVRDVATSTGGSSLTNTATLAFAAGTVSAGATTSLAEPNVTLVKSVGTPLAAPRTTTPATAVLGGVGQTVTYQLAVTNTGSWTAYDVQVADEPDSVSSQGACTGDSRLVATTVQPGPGWTVTDGTLGSGDACLGFTIPTLSPGQTVTITYTLTVPAAWPRAELFVGPELVNSARVSGYFGLPASERAGNPDVRSYPTSATTANGYVDLPGGALGGHVWLDFDADGVQGAGEPGVPGVTVTIDGATGTLTRTTDATGQWLTDDGRTPPALLPPGDYTVTVDTAALPGGLAATFDPDGVLDSSTVVSLPENGVDLDSDFGFTGTGSLGDRVWLDLDGDGLPGPDEPGVPGAQLQARWSGVDQVLGTADDVTLGTTTTAADGTYVSSGVPAGPSLVTVDASTLPLGLTPGADSDGGRDGVASRVLAAGEDATDVDFGLEGTSSVGDRVWWDLDGDGQDDPGEPGIPGVRLDAVWGGFDGVVGTSDDAALAAVTTDDEGRYRVDRLPAGEVDVTVDRATLPAGMAGTYEPDGILDGRAFAVLQPGQSLLTVDFGFTGTRAIGGLVWRDDDRDGARQPGEPALDGVGLEIRYLGADGVPGGGDDVTIATRTAATATVTTLRLAAAFVGGDAAPGEPAYRVPGLVAGAYVVTLDAATLPAGTFPFADVDDGDPTTALVTIVDDLDVDFAVAADGPSPPQPPRCADCGGAIAATGADVPPWLPLTALWLVLSGVALVTLRRRAPASRSWPTSARLRPERARRRV